ncbi:MAG TPA: aromatic-ring-hydroxylating dioxygenase subunit beta [Acidimicrobiales bacterium]|nr:aromatic-ring-hydroxylating dioxygenase subunit beta [Acidimicrobiales bacterium]
MTTEAVAPTPRTSGRSQWFPPPSDGALAPRDVQQDVALFLALEAEAFDARRFDEWTAMLDDGFTYRVPVPVVRDGIAALPFDPGSLLIDETKESIVDVWLARLGQELYDLAWGEHPPYRFRHHVSNLRVRTTETPGTYLARSNVLLTMIRQSTDPAHLGAERYDLVRQEGSGWMLCSRYCVVDTVVLHVPQVRVML